MKRSPPEILNKEKLLFLVFALVFGVGLYRLLSSAPLPLEPGKPMTEKSVPEELHVAAVSPTLAERDYLRGSRNPMLKPKPPPVALQKLQSIDIPSPPSQPNEPGDGVAIVKRILDPASLDLEYMGIVIADGKSCALLRSKKSSITQRVLPGQSVAGTNVSVTKIEPWGVWLSDGQGVGVLKNERFDAPKPESASRAAKLRNREPSVFF